MSVAELEVRAHSVAPTSDTRWEFGQEVERERQMLIDGDEYLARQDDESTVGAGL